MRKWRSYNKKDQIKYIKDKKSKYDDSFINYISDDLVNFLNDSFSNIKGFLLTCAPVGNSLKKGYNLSTEICKISSKRLGIQYKKIFSDFPKKTLSVGNLKDKMDTKLICDISSPLILFDDIATTGTTISNCLNILKNQDVFVVPVVWCYGDVVDVL